MAQKVLNKDDIYFLHNDIDPNKKFIVKDSGVYLLENGDWMPGIEFVTENGNVEFTPYEVFYELHRKGLLYKQGNEKVASVLRANRKVKRK